MTDDITDPTNVLEMSDEDLLKMSEPTDAPIVDEEQDVTDDPNQEAEEDVKADANDDDEGPDDEDPGEAQAEETESGHEAAEIDENEGEEAEESSEEGENLEAEPDPKPAKKAKKKEVTEEDVSIISSDDQIKELFSPFRANGKEMQVSSIADARTLMQMGANYNKKMQGLKPNLKLMKMLDNNKLLDEEKLTYLIDLSNKNPEAIAKLVQDSGIDPLEMDTEKTAEYKPSTYTVNDNEVELDQVLLDIQDTPTFQETINIVSTKWDDSSKQVLLKNPSLIATINDQVASGIYEQINGIVEQEKMLGKFSELTDLEAYKFVGDVLQKQGAFNKQPQTQTVAPIPKQTKAVEDPKLKAKKRAASGTKSTPQAKTQFYNPLELSDDDFDKATAPI